MKNKKDKYLIGATDHLDLPDLGLEDVPCKIDTGAYTATLHCSDLRLSSDEDGEMLSFRLYAPRFSIHDQREFTFREFQTRKVRSSNGLLQERYSVHLTVAMMGRPVNTEFTLSFRDHMRFPILLGRRFLRNRFIVDVALKDCALQFKKDHL